MKWLKVLIYSNGVILMAAGLERFVVAAGDGPALNLADPLLGLPLRYTVLIVGSLELVVAIICLFGKKLGLQLGWVAWLGLDYILLQAGLILMGCSTQATCIGSLTDPLYLTRGTSGLIISLLPIYLFIGSFGGIIWLWRENHAAKPAAYLKMSCPACGTHIRFSSSDVGRRTSCPHCKTAVTLRRPEENLKISCFFCNKHIEFQPHAIGEKIKCPHCKMDITLKEPA